MVKVYARSFYFFSGYWLLVQADCGARGQKHLRGSCSLKLLSFFLGMGPLLATISAVPGAWPSGPLLKSPLSTGGVKRRRTINVFDSNLHVLTKQPYFKREEI